MTVQNARIGSITQTASTDFCAVIGNPDFFNSPTVTYLKCFAKNFNHTIYNIKHPILVPAKPVPDHDRGAGI
jgi:hypothetical protein